ncbi:MAG: hypothetical protein M1318_06615 [Firmicutes bacterium]|nr:hypothetical protein [Bacillota bacterium]
MWFWEANWWVSASHLSGASQKAAYIILALPTLLIVAAVSWVLASHIEHTVLGDLCPVLSNGLTRSMKGI